MSDPAPVRDRARRASSAGTGPPGWTVASSLGALVALVGGWLIAEAVQPPGYDPVRMTISALARHGAEHRWIMTAGFTAVGVFHLVTAAGLRGARPRTRLVLAAAGIEALAIAVFAQPPDGSAPAHVVSATLSFATLALFPVLAAREGRDAFPVRHRDTVVAAAISLGLLGWFLLTLHSGGALGLTERLLTFQQQLWPVLVVLGLRRAARRRHAVASARVERMSR